MIDKSLNDPAPETPANQAFEALLALRAVGAQSLNLSNTTITYRCWPTTEGPAPSLLCLHAIGHGSADFKPLVERVGSRCNVIALDWPVEGHSGTKVPHTAAAYGRLVIEACDALALERPIVLGNSIGGAAAIEAALADPQRFAGVVLCNSGGLAPVTAVSRFAIARMVSFFRAGARGARWFPRAFDVYYRAVLPAAAARARRAQIVAAAPYTAETLALAWEGFADPAADLRKRASRIAVPVFAAWARSDRILPWSGSRAAIEAMPDHTCELFDGGHAAFIEDPDRFAEALLAFADGLSSGREENAA